MKMPSLPRYSCHWKGVVLSCRKDLFRASLFFLAIATRYLLMPQANKLLSAKKGHMITPIVLHEDAFYEYFKPYRHPDACYDIWGGLGLETFGKDLDTVRKLDASY